MLSKSKDAGHQVALTGPLDTTGSRENEKKHDGTHHVQLRRNHLSFLFWKFPSIAVSFHVQTVVVKSGATEAI
jgi:hypothetical protein